MKIHIDELDALKPVYSKITEQARWTTTEEVVVEHPAHGHVLYLFTYGSTEMQEMERSEMYDADADGMVEVTPVELREVTVKKWMPRDGAK